MSFHAPLARSLDLRSTTILEPSLPSGFLCLFPPLFCVLSSGTAKGLSDFGRITIPLAFARNLYSVASFSIWIWFKITWEGMVPVTTLGLVSVCWAC